MVTGTTKKPTALHDRLQELEEEIAFVEEMRKDMKKLYDNGSILTHYPNDIAEMMKNTKAVTSLAYTQHSRYLRALTAERNDILAELNGEDTRFETKSSIATSAPKLQKG